MLVESLVGIETIHVAKGYCSIITHKLQQYWFFSQKIWKFKDKHIPDKGKKSHQISSRQEPQILILNV